MAEARLVGQGFLRVRGPGPQQAVVEALINLAVGVAQAIVIFTEELLFGVDGQVAGLKQKRLGGEIADLEGREEIGAGLQAAKVRQPGVTLGKQIDEKGRGAGLEPVGSVLALLKQQQEIEGVVDRIAGPVVPVVPGAQFLPLQGGQFRAENLVEIRLGIAADGRVAAIDGDVVEIVQARKQAALAELGHAGQEGEANMGVAVLDDRIEVAQAIAQCPSGVGGGEVVEDGLVVFVDQNDHPLATGGMGLANQLPETAGQGRLSANQAQGLLIDGKQFTDFQVQLGRIADDRPAKAQADDRKAPAPVPAVMNRQAAEQGLVAGEKFAQGIQEQGFAEPPRPGEEVILALVVQT